MITARMKHKAIRARAKRDAKKARKLELSADWRKRNGLSVVPYLVRIYGETTRLTKDEQIEALNNRVDELEAYLAQRNGWGKNNGN